jgi:hypothetical protein
MDVRSRENRQVEAPHRRKVAIMPALPGLMKSLLVGLLLVGAGFVGDANELAPRGFPARRRIATDRGAFELSL